MLLNMFSMPTVRLKLRRRCFSRSKLLTVGGALAALFIVLLLRKDNELGITRLADETVPPAKRFTQKLNGRKGDGA